MASTRLPGKVLLELAGRPVIEHVVERCGAIAGVSAVCLTVPSGPESDVIAAMAPRLGAQVHRGPEHDVLERYRLAAAALDADIVMRITSDCPLIDPEVCGEVLALTSQSGADYGCNNMPRSFPHGLDCEVFTRAALERCAASAREPVEREHVTPWLRTNAAVKRVALEGPGGAAALHRWTLDFPEDYCFLSAVYEALPAAANPPGYRQVMAIIETSAQLRSLEAAARRRAEQAPR